MKTMKSEKATTLPVLMLLLLVSLHQMDEALSFIVLGDRYRVSISKQMRSFQPNNLHSDKVSQYTIAVPRRPAANVRNYYEYNYNTRLRCDRFGGDDQLDYDEESLPEPVLGRRKIIQSSISTAIASSLLQASGASDAAAVVEGSWLASPSIMRIAVSQLKREADLAATLVTPSVRDDYHRNGVTVVRGAVSKRWIDALRIEGCEAAQDEPGPYAEYLQKATDSGIYFTDLELAPRLPLFSAFAQYGPCAAIAGSVMGSTGPVRYLYDQLFVKEQGVSTTTPWHQDGGYWRVKGPQISSVFVPLDSVEPSESLAFVKGSQEWELHNPQHFADGTPYTGSSLPEMPDVNQMVKRNEVILQSFRLDPGDVVVFSSKTTHGGPGNWGRALSTRWTGDDARFWDRPGEGAVPTGDVRLADGELLASNSAAFPECWRSS